MPYSIQTGRNLPDVCDPKNVCCLSSLMSLSAPRILYQPKKSKLKKSYVNNVWPLRQKRSECLTIFTCKAVHQPFERTGMPFERLQLTVLKNSSSVRTVRAMRSTKRISRSNGSSYPFQKIHQPFERLELSARENSSAVPAVRAKRSTTLISRSNGSSYPFEKIHQPFERLELSIQERNSNLFWQPFQEDKTRRLQNNKFAILC